MKRIMVIDDEIGFCNFVHGVLEDQGYSVSVCSKSTRAFSKIMAARPDLILLDIKMPGVSGDCLAAQLRTYDETKNIPIVFISVLVDEEEAKERDNIFGSNIILPKPLKVYDLLQVVKSILGKPAA